MAGRNGATSIGFLGKAHPRWSTPYAAILIQSAIAVAMVLLLRGPEKPGRLFDKLTTYFVVVEWIDGNRSPVWGLLIMAAGFPVYAVWRRCARRPPELPA